MRITKRQLRRIIKEELLREQARGMPQPMWEDLPPVSEWEDYTMTEEEGGFQFAAAKALSTRPEDIVTIRDDDPQYEQFIGEIQITGSPMQWEGTSTSLGTLFGTEVAIVNTMGSRVITARKSDVGNR